MNGARALRWWLLGAGVIGALIVSGPAAAMAPNARDVTATRRFIAAETRFDRAELARRRAIAKATNAYLTRVKAGCAGDMPITLFNGGPQPQRKVYRDLVKEASFDFYAAATRPIRNAERGLLHALRRVHFTQPRLSALVFEIVLGNEPDTPNNLCADVKAAAGGAFRGRAGGNGALAQARRAPAVRWHLDPGPGRPQALPDHVRRSGRVHDAAGPGQALHGLHQHLRLDRDPPAAADPHPIAGVWTHDPLRRIPASHRVPALVERVSAVGTSERRGAGNG